MSKHGMEWTLCVCILTILVSILPMGLSPYWNGELPGFRDQYERIAESFSKGQLSFDIDVDSRLLSMDNPYDPQARTDLDINYLYWDHAFYKGKLFMYFGVVPAVTLFLPYLYITGNSLTTYHATQFYVAFFIIGLFLLFNMLARIYFRRMPISVFLLLGSTLSLMSVVYAVATPSLYCTAQSAAFCFMTWGIFFLFLAVHTSKNEKWKSVFAVLGTTCGALVFGCRPTIALANLMFVPILAKYLKQCRKKTQLAIHLFYLLLPYFIIAICIMWYNYARFDNPFEFGQSYQLTIVDQTSFSDWTSRINRVLIWDCLKFCFFEFPADLIPVMFGVLVSYPIIVYASLVGLRKDTFLYIEETSLLSFVLVASAVIVLIPLAIAIFSPFCLPRYRMDFLWIIAISVFILLGSFLHRCTYKHRNGFVVSLLSLLLFLVCLRQYLYPYDFNYTKFYSDKVLPIVHQFFFPWSSIY